MDKKMFAILGILAVVMIGCAYAAETATISGENFTVPDGFKENVGDAVVNESFSEDGYKYVINAKTFENDNQSILIDVFDYDDNITDDMLKDLGNQTTINNITGSYVDTGVVNVFSYIKDNKLVTITAINDFDGKLIEEVLS